MRFWRAIPLAAVGGLLLGACGGNPAPGGVTPADIPALEAERAKHPADPSVLTRIGIAYYDAKDYTRAQDALKGALAVEKGNYPATVYLGLSQEAAGNLSGARASYTAAGTLARNNAEKGEVRGLLTLLTRKELAQAAKDAVARESELSKQPPTDNTVAVFPFRYLGTNPDLKPLESGLTYLVVTDLSKVNRLTLLERTRVQSLVDEMALTESGKTDPTSGARSGRMLRAADVVQGSLQNGSGGADRLKLDASVVATTSSAVVASGSANDDLKKLFDMEKQVVFQLLQKMNIQLSPAEQRAISERPTADLQAFLAFSSGLEAEDRGDFKAAGEAYGRAAARDPNFRAAKERQTNVLGLSGLGVSAPVALGSLGGPNITPGNNLPTNTGDLLRNLIGGTVPGTGHQIEIATRPPDERHNLPEVNGGGITDPSGGLTGTIIIIITRP